MKTTVHIISHSHWDREWYQAFELHRMKLVKLMDDCLELFEKNPDFKHFHLDGQTIVMDDYLEIKPEKKAQVEKMVREGKFSAGPWYILQDEFLTSGESNVRNLLVGRQEALAAGKLCPIGYFPDAFGNAGQMPQLLKQAGMKAVVFGRGVKPVGADNQLLGDGEYESNYSEMYWQSPDGSTLPGILFANWYNNGVEIPVEEEAAKQFWEQGLQNARRYAGTSQLLFMNGCDHQPVQKDITEAIRTAKKLYPDIEFVHSDFETYVDAVCKEMAGQISTVKGELISQETDGKYTLVGTTSAHVDLKQLNRRCETALENMAEPLSVLAGLQGKEYPEDLLRYSWKKLMQNHPHDSICCCSVDEVSDEMRTRFHKSLQVAEQITTENMDYLAARVDVDKLPQTKGHKWPFVVFQTGGRAKTALVDACVDLDRCYEGSFPEKYAAMEALQMPTLVLKDGEGKIIPAQIRDAGTGYGYLLPDTVFRKPYMARRVQVTFEARDVPAMGYRTYYLEETESAAPDQKISTEENTSSQIPVMENENLRVEIRKDGSYDILCKETGHWYRQMGILEDTGDIGDEYFYIQDSGKKALTTAGNKAKVTLVTRGEFGTVYKIQQTLQIPVGADELQKKEMATFVDFYERKAGRSARTVELPIETILTLTAHGRGLQVKTTLDNKAKNHRVRVLFPTALDCQTHLVDSMFEVARRKNRHGKAWKNPCGCEHQQNFVTMEDAGDGLMVANFGLYEYEILPDQQNTIAVTLLRAVAEMGDWGVFPTPGAQMQGTYTLDYEVIPYGAEDRYEAMDEARQFQTKLLYRQVPMFAWDPVAEHPTLPVEAGFLHWNGEGMNLTGLKKKEKSEDIMVRFVNQSEVPRKVTIYPDEWQKAFYRSNVIEEELEVLTPAPDGSICVEAGPFEIVTLGVKIK